MTPHVLHRDTLLSLTAAAQLTGLPPRVLQGMAERGKLPYVTLVGAARPIKRFRRSVLEGLVLESNGGTP